MSTYTKEQLIAQAQEDVDTWRAATEQFSPHPAQKEYAGIRLRVAETALAALTAEPVAKRMRYKDGPWLYKHKGEDGAATECYEEQMLYVTPPAPAASETGVDDDVRGIIALLESNEWAEHCTKTVLGSRLESEITRLVSAAQHPAAIAEVARAALDYIDALPSDVVAALPTMPGFDRDWAENVLAGAVVKPSAAIATPEILYTCPACGEQSYEDLGSGALRCADCGEYFSKIEGAL